ncbi:MAG: hypothetical protein A2W25_04320 [candidate division Zixibacteria bacterium RBG_16_53_22]|nr:MAG: hypothetical protein A2W25_04320 [candidate division Zixibacteria bacterium RBG_16_53_22]
MKESFREWEPKSVTAVYVSKIITIIDAYAKQGYRLTLRQLYYQLVAGGIIPNKPSEYAKLSDILTRARMAGLVDWQAIEDRVRVPKMHSEWVNIADLVDSACTSYRLPRWQDQDHYIELWTEKDAIAGILKPITDKYHITLVVNRGYSSATAMYDAAKRFISASFDGGKDCVILYLGDHDPSGLDMDRDIQDRLGEFGATFTYLRIGLTWDQIQQYNPPPNPAKISDPRADEYIKKYGESSWEVDSLPPNVLNQLVKAAILGYLDEEKYEAWIEMEDEDKEELRKAAEDIVKEDE